METSQLNIMTFEGEELNNMENRILKCEGLPPFLLQTHTTSYR